jgi:hypothetical protein
MPGIFCNRKLLANLGQVVIVILIDQRFYGGFATAGRWGPDALDHPVDADGYTIAAGVGRSRGLFINPQIKCVYPKNDQRHRMQSSRIDHGFKGSS